VLDFGHRIALQAEEDSTIGWRILWQATGEQRQTSETLLEKFNDQFEKTARS
jgi:hypothetical protein